MPLNIRSDHYIPWVKGSIPNRGKLFAEFFMDSVMILLEKANCRKLE